MFYFIKHSQLIFKNDREKIRTGMISAYHIIEKGLAMPDRRLGFGKGALLGLINQSEKYINKFGIDDEQVKTALSVIKKYDVIHKESNFLLDVELQKSIDRILENKDVESISQYEFTREEFFSNVDKPFDKFSLSRHSTRHFCGEVELESIKKAVDLARHAPSACNMQPTKIHIVADTELVKKIVDMQQGNRGFGHLIDKVVVLTVKISSCSKLSSRFSPFIDSGIFTMNLLYSLHFYKIGAIPLIWLNTSQRNKKLRDILKISSDEIPCIIIGCGQVDNYSICPASPRDRFESLCTIH
jgi:nitroreductase